MRLLICGDRDYNHAAWVGYTIDHLAPTMVIEGEARGADTIARQEAERRDIPVLRFPADWRKFGRAAGPIRNQQMLDEGEPDLVIAFHDDICHSAGTADMLCRAEDAGIPYTLITR